MQSHKAASLDGVVRIAYEKIDEMVEDLLLVYTYGAGEKAEDLLLGALYAIAESAPCADLKEEDLVELLRKAWRFHQQDHNETATDPEE